jgi:aspartyl-tRNA(Asn)/glutamyl-tRNA(Gln) amidotransferase subunit A
MICPGPQSGDDVTRLTLRQATCLVRDGQLSPVELTSACLRRIEQLDPELHAFITVSRDTALEQARTAETEIRSGRWRGPLHGIPVALKDLIDVTGVPTTAASRVFQNRVPAEDAEVVRRLRLAGAVLIGKTNLHEFAYGGSSVISAYGAIRNPLAQDRSVGGSSGGSAAAVASGMCFAALGTDTAGSIRLPASCCGIVGLKPTYGLVSARGVVPLAWSFDHVGPMARTVGDVALVLKTIAGYDSADIDSRRFAACDYVATLDGDLSRLRLGIVREYFFDDIDPEVATRVNEAVVRLESITAALLDVTLPIDTDRTVHNAEAWSYHREHVASAPELFQPETLKRIRRGADIPAVDYIRARRHVETLRRQATHLFRNVDILVTPTVPILPPTIAELTSDLDNLRAKELILLRNTRPFNVLGLPAISVPCGTTRSGLAVGLQLAAAPGAEAKLFAVANAWEELNNSTSHDTSSGCRKQTGN